MDIEKWTKSPSHYGFFHLIMSLFYLHSDVDHSNMSCIKFYRKLRRGIWASLLVWNFWFVPTLVRMSNLIMNCGRLLNERPIISVNSWNEFIFGNAHNKGQEEVYAHWVDECMHLSIHVMTYEINYVMTREPYCGFHRPIITHCKIKLAKKHKIFDLPICFSDMSIWIFPNCCMWIIKKFAFSDYRIRATHKKQVVLKWVANFIWRNEGFGGKRRRDNINRPTD